MLCNTLLPLLALCGCVVHATLDLGFEGGDSDLTTFVTRPEIKAPLFNVAIHDSKAVAPGHWLVAPYVGLHQPEIPPNAYQPCQIGPHIYDAQGTLIWSGACLAKNQVTSDFRQFRANGSNYLSAILYRSESDPEGHAILMDESYQVTDTVHVTPDIMNLDMHEFQIIENGQRGLQVTHKTKWMNVSALGDRGIQREGGFVMDAGVREFDLSSGDTTFEWWMSDHVPLSHSLEEIVDLDGPAPLGWNPYHVNSVDKDEHGDYLISSRFTDCIYKVSGMDGTILWRLGGVASSFVQEDFNFSKQHDARFVEQNPMTTIISFLDNASSGPHHKTASSSSALMVALSTSTRPMTAKVIRRHVRPDGALTDRRGNVQLLPNDNIFVCWSENSLISEHTADGRTVMEAQWTSNRYITYRAYKTDFRGFPADPPALKVFQYGMRPDSGTIACYVSWNGATEVAFWELYRAQESYSGSSLLGRAPKSGFETVFQFPAWETEVYAQAISSDGRILGRSAVEAVIQPPIGLVQGARGPAFSISSTHAISEHIEYSFEGRSVSVGQRPLLYATAIMFGLLCIFAFLALARRSSVLLEDTY